MKVTITNSVGEGGKNTLPDVRAIQQLLNKWITPPLIITGACNGTAEDITVKAIKKYQSEFVSNPDGLIDPNGKTLRNLNTDWTLLPQEFGLGSGYYQYGKSADISKRQWGTEKTIQTLIDVSKQFQALQLTGFGIPFGVPFGIPLSFDFPPTLTGIGDVSFKFGGAMSPHSTHKEGRNVDLRPCRIDKAQLPVRYDAKKDYDQVKTKILIELFLANSNVEKILFNDPEIRKLSRVSYCDGHNDHFHITMKE